jgi:hypothetical protein
MGEYTSNYHDVDASPKEIWDRLNLIDRLIITAIQTSQNKRGVTIQELVDVTKKSTEDVLRIVITLVSQGLLIRDTDGLRGSVYCYTLTHDFSEYC